MKQAIEIDLTDGPVPALEVLLAITDYADEDAVVSVVGKPEHLRFGAGDPYAMRGLVLRIEWDNGA